MRIDQLVEMAERMHDDEGWDLGSASTRETRNQFWARVIGCAHHGHPRYNPNPDKQWHLKRADAGRPQTDDVATSMPSRSYWDCINGVGRDRYTFQVNGHTEPLSADQIVYAPPVPSGSSPSIPPPRLPPYPGDPVFDAIGVALFADYGLALQAPNPQMGRWFGRTVYDYLAGMPIDDSIKKHRREWRDALGLPPILGLPPL